MEDEDGCVEIQEPTSPASTPLVLIHDGSGSIFSYHLLSDLSPRGLYGIANPNFDTSTSWEGGIPAMASRYAAYITAAFPRGTALLLGGWSLGGMLALQLVATLAAEYPDAAISVKGLLLIDSPCPLAPVPEQQGVEVVEPELRFPATTREDVRRKVAACMADGRRAIADWELPRFEGPGALPRAVLLRAEGRVVDEVGKLVRVDVARGDPLLGWGAYHDGEFIAETLDIQGSHYDIFKMDYLEELTDKIKLACSKLDV